MKHCIKSGATPVNNDNVIPFDQLRGIKESRIGVERMQQLMHAGYSLFQALAKVSDEAKLRQEQRHE